MGFLDGPLKITAERIADNAAAFVAGTAKVIPGAWLYKVAVPVMTDGYAGIPRMSKRRVPFAAADYQADALGDDVIQSGTDIITNTTDLIVGSPGATTPTTAWFTGSDAGFDGNPRYIYIPMDVWLSARIGIFDSLNASVTYTLVGLTSSANDTVAISACPIKLDEVTLGSSDGTFQQVTFGMFNLGAAGSGDTPGTTGGSYYRAVPAIGMGWKYLAIKVTPAADPTSGVLRIRVYRSSL